MNKNIVFFLLDSPYLVATWPKFSTKKLCTLSFMERANYSIYELTEKIFWKLHVSFLRNFGKIFTIGHTVFGLHLFILSVEVLFQRHSRIKWLRVDISVVWFSLSSACLATPSVLSLFQQVYNENHVIEILGYLCKKFSSSANDCWVHNGSINLVKKTGYRKLLSLLLIMLPKHHHIYQSL